MKKIKLLIFATIILASIMMVNIFASASDDELRGVFISSVYNSDFPKTKDNPEAQKQEFINILDTLKDTGINAVFMQVRPKGDALYESEINPYSDVLTGIQGKDPGYDIMNFMIEETHKRGMEFHAWLNPYRVTTSGTDISVLSDDHFAKRNPDTLITYNNALYYNPEDPAVKLHIKDTVAEIVNKYDVDGIHFDDYFYPTNYPLPEGEGRDGATANFRRQTTSELIRDIHDTIKALDPDVSFGVSPIGIWKNSKTDPYGSETNGSEGYYTVFADPVDWVKNGYVDYIAPQIYWETTLAAAPYEKVLEFWDKVVDGTDVDLYVAQGIYKDAISKEIKTQLDINKKYDVKGSIFFSLKDILNNRQGVTDALKAYYSNEEEPKEEVIPQPKPEEKPDVPDISTVKKDAIFNQSAVSVDGENINFEAYNIDGYNYFKLRDVAAALKDGDSAFNVLWDESKFAINIVTDSMYSPIGNELQIGSKTNKIATQSTAKLFVNGENKYIEAYNIDGNTYYKLRDLADIIGFNVIWNENTETIFIVS